MKSTQGITRVLDLLDQLQSLSPGEGIPDDVDQELIRLARQTGAGAFGKRGKEYEGMRKAVETDPAKRKRLLSSLSSRSPYARSWAGSFVEQLLPGEEAIPILIEALDAETDPEAASWLSMNLARSLRGSSNSEACAAIGRAYDRSTSAPKARLHTARAWGYAGCLDALPHLASQLLSGGYDQKTIALDGLGTLGSADNPKAVKALWTTFETAPWPDILSKCARLLVLATETHRSDAVKRMVQVLSDASASRQQREAAAEAVSEVELPGAIKEDCFLEVVAALVLNDGSIAANVFRTLKRSYSDWASRLSKLAVASQDESLSAGLIRALASDDEARVTAVEVLRGYITDDDPAVRDRATAALKEIGGEEAFQTLQDILKSRYIQPSDKLQDVSHEVFKDTIQRMRRNYETSVTMNRVVFWLGFGVIIVGIVSVFIDPAGNKFFGAAGVIAGLGTLVSLFFFGPLTRVQHALTELVQIEVAFMSFMHRLLQARSIFEQLYLAQSIDLDALSRFDELLEKGMCRTVELLEENTGKVHSPEKTPKGDST